MFLFHYHVFPPGMLDKNNPKRGTVDELVEILERLGIEKAAVFPVFNFPEARPFASPEFDPNKWIYEVLREKGYGNIYPFIIVNPKDGWSAIQTLREYLNKGFVGVKIHPPIYKIRVNDPAFHQFYYTCEELQVPVVFHTGVFRHWKLKYYRPLLLDEVAQEYPQMPIILAHTGGVAFFHEALAVIQNNPNCYAELSGTLNPNSPWHIPEENLKLLIRLVGSFRIIYGADTHSEEQIRRDIEYINSLDISQEDKENILGGTLESLIQRTGKKIYSTVK